MSNQPLQYSWRASERGRDLYSPVEDPLCVYICFKKDYSLQVLRNWNDMYKGAGQLGSSRGFSSIPNFWG